MRHLILVLAGLLFATAAGAQQPSGSFVPMHGGIKPRPAGWNQDGAPRPPAMWRGHGGDMWPNHFKACKQRYSSYNSRTDTYRHNGRRIRCAL